MADTAQMLWGWIERFFLEGNAFIVLSHIVAFFIGFLCRRKAEKEEYCGILEDVREVQRILSKY